MYLVVFISVLGLLGIAMVDLIGFLGEDEALYIHYAFC